MCIAAIVPTLNHKEALAQLASTLREAGVRSVVVVDMGSTDGTPQEAERLGFSVMRLEGASRSYAVREALLAVDAPYVLVASPEALPPPQDVKLLLSRLRHYDIAVAACRRGVASWLIRALTGARLEDPLAEVYAARTDALREAALEAGGGGEAYWLVKAAANGARIASVPAARCRGSALRAASVAARLLPKEVLAGVLLMALGLAAGNWVAYRYFYGGVPHYTLGLAALASMILGGALLAAAPLLSALRKARAFAERRPPTDCLPPYVPLPPPPKPPEASLLTRAMQGLAAAFATLLALGAYYLAIGDQTTSNKLAEWAYYALVGAVALALGVEVADSLRRRRRLRPPVAVALALPTAALLKELEITCVDCRRKAVKKWSSTFLRALCL